MVATHGLVEVTGHGFAEVLHIHHAVVHVLVLQDLIVGGTCSELLFAHFKA